MELGVGKNTEPNQVKPNQPNRNQFQPNQCLFQTIRLKIFLIRMVRFYTEPNRETDVFCNDLN